MSGNFAQQSLHISIDHLYNSHLPVFAAKAGSIGIIAAGAAYLLAKAVSQTSVAFLQFPVKPIFSEFCGPDITRYDQPHPAIERQG